MTLDNKTLELIEAYGLEQYTDGRADESRSGQPYGDPEAAKQALIAHISAREWQPIDPHKESTLPDIGQEVQVTDGKKVTSKMRIMCGLYGEGEPFAWCWRNRYPLNTGTALATFYTHWKPLDKAPAQATAGEVSNDE